MISKFLQEQKRYTQQELIELFDEKEEHKLISIIRKLREYGILKLVRKNKEQQYMTDLEEKDIVIADVEFGENDYFYVFTYVGIINIAGIILKCFPKYINSKNEPIEELKQIVKVLEKINSKEQIINMFNGDKEDNSFNLLALQLYLLNDYYENGIYTNIDSIIETNGMGEIFWDKTINETFAVINNNRPYYTELKTKKNIENDMDYFKKLHEIILSKISKELEDADLLEIFEITGIELSNNELADMGDNDYILYRIERELNNQFNTRKQLLLKAMYTYVNQNGHLYDLEAFSLFGTNNFKRIWEKVCAFILDDKLNTPLSEIELPKKLDSEYNEKDILMNIIEKPLWSVPNQPAKKSLIPDLISCYQKDGKYYFMIFDAKYYSITLEKGETPKNVPGIEDITKQYLYQLAYKEFISKHEIQNVQNCFLMPTESKSYITKGYVSLKMLNNVGLKDIKIRMIPAKEAYDCYLKGNKISIEKLELDKDERDLSKYCEETSREYSFNEDDSFDSEWIAAEENYIMKDDDIFKQNIGKFKTYNGRNIYYYGEEFGDYLTTINNIYEKIKNLNDLFGILLKCWEKDTAHPSAKNEYIQNDSPTFCQSEVTAAIVNEIFGGTVHKIELEKGSIHYFNKIDNHYIDLTKDQFDVKGIKILYEPNDYVESNYYEKSEETLARYNILKNKIKELQ